MRNNLLSLPERWIYLLQLDLLRQSPMLPQQPKTLLLPISFNTTIFTLLFLNPAILSAFFIKDIKIYKD